MSSNQLTKTEQRNFSRLVFSHAEELGIKTQVHILTSQVSINVSIGSSPDIINRGRVFMVDKLGPEHSPVFRSNKYIDLWNYQKAVNATAKRRYILIPGAGFFNLKIIFTVIGQELEANQRLVEKNHLDLLPVDLLALRVITAAAVEDASSIEELLPLLGQGFQTEYIKFALENKLSLEEAKEYSELPRAWVIGLLAGDRKEPVG